MSELSKYYPSLGGSPVSPEIASSPAYQQVVKKNPWLGVFLNSVANPNSISSVVTPGESKFDTATNTVVQELATNKTTPEKALEYVDNQGNSGT